MKSFMIAVAAGIGLLSMPAEARTITGGLTTVEVTADVTGLGLSAAPLGTATFSGGVFGFPITGGSVTGAGAMIEHDGSGVTLSAIADPSVSASIGDFFIDTMAATVSGNIIGGASGVTFFTFGDIDSDGIDLLISNDLAGALTGVFGAPDLTGAVFGVANTAPELAPIPLPAGLPLIATGLLAFGWLRRRKA
ncbi:VPLPA-CTERM sorting domain-containing protein [Sulfitobacter sp. D35]|uniref:VPLPA-CTERM sorting domain-containing protein n=1 Tax=Sulfitobacter sp. D35 TaxID=3083252 RepID=UPI00296FA726|nr:VPLPA-CTERM sorting domain-containing protein [Sulfitobacter sp. D35]MDW4496783.1 VPLPA-CTERM sorting domain-containing protein [Sulfitobacter sp. D35]